MMSIEKNVAKYDIPVFGYCTDSAANSLGALEKLLLPNFYNTCFCLCLASYMLPHY